MGGGTGEPAMRFDRRVPAATMALLAEGGPFAWLPEMVRDDDSGQLDLQLRADHWTGRPSAALYAGLTVVLEVRWWNDLVRLHAHATHRSSGGFDPAWTEWQRIAVGDPLLDAVRGYVATVVRTVRPSLIDKEGRVHAALCRPFAGAFAVVQREASPAFRDTATHTAICAPLCDPLTAAVRDASAGQPWWPTRHGIPRIGNSPDLLGIDERGRLLVIEAKPATALKGIVWGPVQVRYYAELWAALWARQQDLRDVIGGMLDQRVALGLSRPVGVLPADPVIVPVLAIGPGSMSATAVPRMREVWAMLPASDVVAPMECWRIGAAGMVEQMDWEG